MLLTIAMPNQVMAQGLFDRPPEPKILESSEVDTNKEQAILDTPTKSGPAPGKSKPDRTKLRELTTKRTASSSTYINKDGTKTTEFSTKQRNYKKNGKWEQINNVLSPVKENDPTPNFFQSLTGQLPKADPPSRFTAKAGDLSLSMKPITEGVSIGVKGKTFTVKPVNSNYSLPEQKNATTVVYRDVWKGIDLEYEARGELLKENIIVKSKDAVTSFDFRIEGAKLIDDPKNPGQFAIEGLEDQYQFGALSVLLNDKGIIDHKDFAIQQRTDKNSIKVTVDKNWLASLSKQAFPVTVDPSFGRWDIDTSSWMFKSDGYQCQGNTCWIQAGTLNDNGWKHWRSYIHFPYPELAGKKVLDANIHAYYNPNANPDPNQRYLFFGHANCIGWECRGTHLATVLTAGDFDVNVTGRLQNAVNNGDMGAAWSFWGEEVPYKTFKTYSDMHLSVVYDTPTPVATPVEPLDKQVTISTQPTLRVNSVSDADGDAVQYYFRVSTSPDAETGAVINSGWVTSPQWTIPDGILQDGTTYYWHTYTLGATQTNPNWARSFKLDLRTGKDSTQSYDTVGPIGIDLATGNATTSTETHSMSALGGSIGLSMDYNTPSKSRSGLTGQYWNVSSNNTNPSGDPVFTRNDQDINFSWPNGSSPGAGINADWFVAKWKGYFVAPNTGSYQFGASNDDAISINVNGQIFGGCYGANPCYNNSSITLSAGQAVPIEIQFTEATGDAYTRVYVKGAVAEQLLNRDWLRTEVTPSVAQYGLSGRYYSYDGTPTFPESNGDPMRLMMARNDSKLAFNWGGSGPASGLQSDSFMAKWTGYITVPATGTYKFGAVVDDGIRIKLNNGLFGAQQTVMDVWQDGARTNWGNDTSLSKGQQVPITIEYYERTGSAQFTLLIKDTNGVEQEMPVKWLTPKATALPDAWRLGVDVDGDVGYERLRVAGQNIILEDSTRATHEYTWTGSGYKPPVNEDGQLTRNANNTYTLLDTDGRTYIFDAEGKLTSLTTATDDRKPASLKYEYAGDPSRLIKITDGVTNSRYGTLHYRSVNEDGNCNVPSGFDAAPDGMLCAFKTSDGDITKLFYKADQLSRIEKPDSERIDYGYDPLGRISTTRDAIANDAISASVRPNDNSVLTEVSYDQLGRARAIKAPAPATGVDRVEHTLDYSAASTTALYRHWKDPENKASTLTSIPGYDQTARLGYMLTEQKSGTHAVYSCQVNWDEFISTDANCEGYSKLGLLGFAYDTPDAGVGATIPLQRCVYLPTGDHFIWPDTTCGTRHNEGTKGYLLSTPINSGSTNMNVVGAQQPHGFSKRIQYDSLLRTVKETDVSNATTSTEWDGVKDLELSKTDPTGLKSTTIYDDDDRAIENYGSAPSSWYGSDRKPLPSYVNQIPKTSASYEEGISGPEVTYFNYKADNKSLVGAPKLRTNGLTDASGSTTTPAYLEKVWGSSRPITPDAGMSGWGMRATGKLRVPTTGSYTFHFWHDDGMRVYIDDTIVADDWNNGGNRRTDATKTLEAGKVYRILIEYYDVDNNAMMGLYMSSVNTQPTAADRDWSAELKPGFGLKTSETAYDSQLGNVTTSTSYSKPEYGLVDKTILDPTGLNYQSTATYEAPGTGFFRQTSKTLPGGGTTTYQLYGAEEVKDNPCTPETETIVQAGRQKGKTESDPDGAGAQAPRVSENIYSHAGEVVATRYNNDPWTCTTYDARGRVLTISIPAIGAQPSRTITNDYKKDGNPLVTTTSDSKGTIRVENDLLGRTTKYIDVHGKVTQNTYDMYGKLMSRTSPIGTESYEYDQFDRLTKHKLDGSTYATVTYDQYSRLASVQYPTGVSLSNISRDALGRENGTSFSVSSTTSSTTGTSSAVQTLRQGVDTASINAADGNYDGTPHNPTTFTLNSLNGTYDSAKTSQFSLPVDAGTSVGNGTQARLSYDFTGDGSWDRQETYNYFATDPVTGYETYTQSKGLQSSTGTFANLQNGKVKVEVWNAIGNGASTLATSQTAGPNQSTLTLPFTMGSGTQITNTAPVTYTDTIERYVSGDIKQGTENGVTKQYTYDNAGRLTGATIGTNIFAYEFGAPDAACNGLAGNNPNAGKNGNRTKLIMNGQVTTYCYDMADRLIASSDATLTNPLYDTHGNTTSLGDATHKTEFKYDSSDRNIAIKANNKETLYGRDAQDRVVSREHKVDNLTTSIVAYGFTGSGDSPDYLLDNAGSVTQKYLTLPGDVVVTIKPGSTGANASTYSLPNIHGDIYLTVDADGVIKSTHQTGPFGEQLAGQLAAGNTAEGTSWGYLGQHQKMTDTSASPINSGIVQMGARVYLPSLGRFLQVDPVEGGGDNNYVYVNDPVNNDDLDGRIAPLVAFAAWQLGRIAVQQAIRIAAQQAARQAAQQVLKKAAAQQTKKTLQWAAGKPHNAARNASSHYNKQARLIGAKNQKAYNNSARNTIARAVDHHKYKNGRTAFLDARGRIAVVNNRGRLVTHYKQPSPQKLVKHWNNIKRR